MALTSTLLCLSVRSAKPVTPKQVRLLEAIVEQEMGRPFSLIFSVSQVEEAMREDKINLS